MLIIKALCIHEKTGRGYAASCDRDKGRVRATLADGTCVSDSGWYDPCGSTGVTARDGCKRRSGGVKRVKKKTARAGISGRAALYRDRREGGAPVPFHSWGSLWAGGRNESTRLGDAAPLPSGNLELVSFTRPIIWRASLFLRLVACEVALHVAVIVETVVLIDEQE